MRDADEEAIARQSFSDNLGSVTALKKSFLAIALSVCVIAIIARAALAAETSAPGSETITLPQALSVARAQNPDLAAAQQELGIAYGEVQKAAYLSQFNFESDNQFDYRLRYNRSNSQDWRLAFMQEFEVFGQRELRRKSAAIRLDQRSAEFVDQIRLLVAAVKLTFLDAMRARDRVRLLSDLEGLDSRLLEAARKRVAAGEIGQIDFNLAAVRHGRSHRALLQGREQYRFQRSSLGRLLGGQAGPEPVPAGEVTAPPMPPSIEVLLESARSNRPDLRARQLEIARLETEASLNNRLNLPNPIIGVGGDHSQNTNYGMSAMFGFSVPIFNRRTGEATIIAAQQRQAKSRFKAIGLDIERQVRDAYNQYLTAYESLQVYQDEVATPARESFDLLERAFTEGKIDLLRLSVAERDAFEAQVSYYDAWFDLRAAEVAIELATGTSS